MSIDALLQSQIYNANSFEHFSIHSFLKLHVYSLKKRKNVYCLMSHLQNGLSIYGQMNICMRYAFYIYNMRILTRPLLG